MNPLDLQKKLFIYVFLDIYNSKDREKTLKKYNETYKKFIFSFVETRWKEPQLRMKELLTGIIYTITIPTKEDKFKGDKVHRVE